MNPRFSLFSESSDCSDCSDLQKSIQSEYSRISNEFPHWETICPDCRQSTLHRHGSYKRRLICRYDKIIEICFDRVRCPHCGKTHALIPSNLIGFSLFTLQDVILILVFAFSNTLQKTAFKFDTDPELIEHLMAGCCSEWSSFSLSKPPEDLMKQALEERCLGFMQPRIIRNSVLIRTLLPQS